MSAPDSPSVLDGNEDPPNRVVDAINKKKQPPPESPESIRTRKLVILSFWAVVIFIGLPVWWKTTTVYRADLPLQEMLDWADGKVYNRSNIKRLKLIRSPSRSVAQYSLCESPLMHYRCQLKMPTVL